MTPPDIDCQTLVRFLVGFERVVLFLVFAVKGGECGFKAFKQQYPTKIKHD